MTVRRAITGLLSLALTGAAIYMAPVQAGGRTSFSVVDGISMNPMLHAGDLVVSRSEPTYRVGDVVLYQNQVIHREVLHRIYKIQGDRFYFKGDNNQFVDPGYATRDELVGKMWVHLPKAGAVLTWAGKPTHSALVAGAMTLLLLLMGKGATSRRKRRKHTAPAAARTPGRFFHRPRRTAENVVFFGAGLLACLAALAGFAQPLHRTASIANAYTQRGSFAYSGAATGRSAVYPAGSVRTGQSIFLADVPKLHIDFTYRFETSRPHAVSGTAEMLVLISSDAISWHRVVAKEVVPFRGDAVTVGTTLDLSRIEKLAQQLVTASGAVGADYNISVRPTIRVRGHVGTTHITDSFAPEMPLTMSESILKVVPTAPTVLPGASYTTPSATSALNTTLNPVQAGTIPGSTANTLGVLRYRIPVSDFRGLALGLALLAVLALLLKPLRPKREIWSSERRIAFRHGCILIGVEKIAASSDISFVTVPRFEDLATLAAQQDAPIMHADGPDGSRYAVEHGRHLYIFEAPATPPSPPAAVQMPKPAKQPKRATRRPFRLLHGLSILGIIVLVAALGVGFTATNTVPASNAGISTQAASVSQLAPAACSGLSLTGVLYVTTNSFSDNQSNMLIVGRTANDNIADAGHNNCIIGGGGQDTVNAQAGSICITNTTPKSNYKGCTKD